MARREALLGTGAALAGATLLGAAPPRSGRIVMKDRLKPAPATDAAAGVMRRLIESFTPIPAPVEADAVDVARELLTKYRKHQRVEISHLESTTREGSRSTRNGRRTPCDIVS